MVLEPVLAQRQSLQDRLEGSAGSDPTDPRSALRHQDRQCRKIPASWLGDRIPRGRDANACPVRGPRIWQRQVQEFSLGRGHGSRERARKGVPACASLDAFRQRNLLPSEGMACEPQCQPPRSEEHTSELQSLMRISYAVFCLKKKNISQQKTTN